MSDGDERPLTFWRAVRQSEFWLLAAAAVAAMFGVAWRVTVPLVVAGLSMSSLPKYIALWPRAREVGAEGEWWRTVARSELCATAAAGGAHVAGVLTRWLWW